MTHTIDAEIISETVETPADESKTQLVKYVQNDGTLTWVELPTLQQQIIENKYRDMSVIPQLLDSGMTIENVYEEHKGLTKRFTLTHDDMPSFLDPISWDLDYLHSTRKRVVGDIIRLSLVVRESVKPQIRTIGEFRGHRLRCLNGMTAEETITEITVERVLQMARGELTDGFSREHMLSQVIGNKHGVNKLINILDTYMVKEKHGQKLPAMPYKYNTLDVFAKQPNWWLSSVRDQLGYFVHNSEQDDFKAIDLANALTNPLHEETSGNTWQVGYMFSRVDNFAKVLQPVIVGASE